MSEPRDQQGRSQRPAYEPIKDYRKPISYTPTELYARDLAARELESLGYSTHFDGLQTSVVGPDGTRILYAKGIFALKSMARVVMYERSMRPLLDAKSGGAR